MPASYMTEQIRQYENMMEANLKNKPKHPRPYGIKCPDTRDIVAVATGIFIILVVAVELL